MSYIPPVESAFGELKPRNSIAGTIPLIGRTVTIGSSATSSDIALSQPGINAQHCRLSKSGRSVMLEDLSNSGTMLNGQVVVGRNEIRTGDVLTLGTLECDFTNLIPGGSPSSTPAMDTINDIDAFTFESSELQPSADKPASLNPGTTADVTADVTPDTTANAPVNEEVWFAEAVGRTLGPLTQDELIRLVQSGGLQPLDMVHHGDQQHAKPCGSVSFLSDFYADSISDQPTSARNRRDSAPDVKARRRKQKKRKSTDHPTKRVRKSSKSGEDEKLIDDMMNDVLLSDQPIPPPVESELPESASTSTLPPASPDKVVPEVTSPTSSADTASSASSATAAIQSMINAAAPTPAKPSKKKRRAPSFNFNFDFDAFKKPALVLGGLAVLYGVYSIFLSAPIDRSAAIEQISKYYEDIKTARQSGDRARLDALAQRIQTETSEIVSILNDATEGGTTGSKADRTILQLIRLYIPEAIKAEPQDTIVIGILGDQIKAAKDGH